VAAFLPLAGLPSPARRRKGGIVAISHAASQRDRINEAIEELRGARRKCPAPELKAAAAIRILRRLDTLGTLDRFDEMRKELHLWEDLETYPATEVVGHTDSNDRNVIVWNHIVFHYCPDVPEFDGRLAQAIWWDEALLRIADLIVTANSEQGEENGEMGSTVKGVSLLDAGLILTEEDLQLAREKKTAWQKLRTPKLPASVGNCPNHRQVKLFAPFAIADFVEKVEGKTLCDKHKLRKRLAAKAREPRQQ
jgi:hypothetical protein